MYEKDLLNLNEAWIIDFSQIIFGAVDDQFASKVRKKASRYNVKNYNCSYTTMAKAVNTLEMHSTMI